MAYCKECGKFVDDSNINCMNCGFPNPNYKIVQIDEFDLDTNTVYEGSYIMPGQPGHVPITGFRVVTGDEVSGDVVMPVEMGSSAPEDYKIEAPVHIEPTTEESVDDTVIIPPVEVDYISEEPAYVPPTETVGSSGGYVPPTNNYVPHSNDFKADATLKTGGLPIPAIIGAAVLLIAVVLFMNMGKGGKPANVAHGVDGVWQSVLFESTDGSFGFDRGSNEAMYIEFKKDNKVSFNADDDPLEGTYKLDKDKITFDLGDEGVFTGIIEDEFIVLDFFEDTLYLAKEGSSVTEKEIALLKGAMNADELNIPEVAKTNDEKLKPVSTGGNPTVTEVSGNWHTFAIEDEGELISYGRDDPEPLLLSLTDGMEWILDPYYDPLMGTWTMDGINIVLTDEYDNVNNATIEDGVLTVNNEGTILYFYQVDSPVSKTETEILARGVYLELADPVGVDYWVGDYIGVYNEEDFWGTMADDDWTGDVTGVVAYEEDTEKHYFEVYMDGIDGSVVSHYVELYDDHMEGVVGEDDAWIWDRYLTEDEEYLLWYGTMYNPQTIYIYYDYVNDAGDGGYTLDITMRKVGESWDDLDYKPDSLK